MRITGVLLLSLCLFGACAEKQDYKGKTPLVEVSGDVLYQEELVTVMPIGLSTEDSLLFAENYIRNWVEDVLLYDLAKLNIPDNDRINRLTENYRKTLVMHAYQQELIEQKLSRELTSDEMQEYYDNNKDIFILEQPLIKGLFIKVAASSTGLNNVRNWYKKNTVENVEALEKFSLNSAINYNYFYDNWILASDVLDRMPLETTDINNFLKNNRHIEIKDEDYVYFLNVDSVRIKGEQKPFEFAQTEIKDMLVNLKRMSFMRNIKTDLYKNAITGKKITYYY